MRKGTRIPKPLKVVSMVSALRRYVGESYGSVIRDDLQWTPDSKGIIFRAESADVSDTFTDDCCYRLYKVDIASHTLHVLSPMGYTVGGMVAARHTIVYKATPLRTYLVGTPIGKDAIDLTDVETFAPPYLWPRFALRGQADHATLWMLDDTLHAKIIGKNAVHPLRLNKSNISKPDVLSLAPDERTLVSLLPVTKVPQSWADFEPGGIPGSARIRPPSPCLYCSTGEPLPLEDYGLIDLHKGTATPLIHAPVAHRGYLVGQLRCGLVANG